MGGCIYADIPLVGTIDTVAETDLSMYCGEGVDVGGRRRAELHARLAVVDPEAQACLASRFGSGLNPNDGAERILANVPVDCLTQVGLVPGASVHVRWNVEIEGTCNPEGGRYVTDDLSACGCPPTP